MKPLKIANNIKFLQKNLNEKRKEKLKNLRRKNGKI